MRFATNNDIPVSPHRPEVLVSLRAIGYDDMPDTFYTYSIPPFVEKLGTGARLLLRFGYGHHESVYAVTLGPVRVRGRALVEFVAFSSSFVRGLCFVQVPIRYAKVSKFAFMDFVRGRFSTIDPVPDRFVRSMQPMATSAAASMEDVSDGSIEIREDVETKTLDFVV